MKYDLLLTETGDISFIPSNIKFKNEVMELNFHIAPTDSLCFNFDITETEDDIDFTNLKPSKLSNENCSFSSCFQYDFYLFTPQFDKTARIVRDRNYLQQAIKLRLSTEIGTVLGNNDLGSDLYKYVHSNMSNNKLLDTIKQQVKKSIIDILPNCEVHVYIINSDYLNFHDSIKIVIINNEETFYYYI